MSAGRTKIASGVDGVGMTVEVGSAVVVGTAVGPVDWVAEPPQELRIAISSTAMKKCLTRKVILQELRMSELYCLMISYLRGAFKRKRDTRESVSLF
jgi:hypothetical protein